MRISTISVRELGGDISIHRRQVRKLRWTRGRGVEIDDARLEYRLLGASTREPFDVIHLHGRRTDRELLEMRMSGVREPVTERGSLCTTAAGGLELPVVMLQFPDPLSQSAQ